MARNDKRIDQLTPSTIPLVGTDLFAIYNANGTRNDTLDSITSYVATNMTGVTSDTYVTGGTLNVNSLELGRNQGLPNISVDLSPLITSNDTYLTGVTLNSTILELNLNQGLPTLSVDLSGFTSTLFTGNTSGDCITDLYVSNIHSCSPLNINPNNEGDVLVGSGGFTFDVVNTRFGIGKSPQYIFDMLGSGFRTYMSDTTDVKKLLISGGTDTLSEFSTVIDYPSLGGLGGISVGTIGPNAVVAGIVPERGQQGDTYIYSSAKANGLNLISADNPSGAEDYIRLYAGQDATSTPDIHIQGSGTTRGYVGLNNNNPQELLDVSGNAVISGNLEIQGQSNNPMYYGGTGSTFTLDFDNSNIQTITLTGNTTINNPSNVKDGAVYTVIMKQGATTGTINSWGSNFKFESGTAPTLTTNAYAVDIMTFISDDAGILYGLIAQDFQ